MRATSMDESFQNFSQTFDQTKNETIKISLVFRINRHFDFMESWIDL